MTTYKISGNTSHDADVHIIQGDSYFGKKAVSAGSYEVTIDSTTSSGIIAVAKKSDGDTVSYGGILGITSSGTADLSVSAGVGINSIQYGTILMAGATLTNTATINEIDTTKSAIFPTGFKAAGGQIYNSLSRIELTDSTTVTAWCTNSLNDVTAGFMVVEFTGGIASTQQGGITLSFQQYNEATISEVNVDKTMLIHLGTTTNAGDANRIFCILSLENSTTVRATGGASNSLLGVNYYVLEFE